jgi:hypothetical protein
LEAPLPEVAPLFTTIPSFRCINHGFASIMRLQFCRIRATALDCLPSAAAAATRSARAPPLAGRAASAVRALCFSQTRHVYVPTWHPNTIGVRVSLDRDPL